MNVNLVLGVSYVQSKNILPRLVSKGAAVTATNKRDARVKVEKRMVELKSIVIVGKGFRAANASYRC